MIPDPISERFWKKVGQDPETGCWPWMGYRDRDGYGRFAYRLDGRCRNVVAHRLAYTLLRGPIMEATLDHLCGNRACVNPAHLQPASLRENILRGNGLAAENARKERCDRGHLFDEENTYAYRGGRYCRACRRGNRRQAAARR